MNSGFYGFPNILGLLRATSLRVLGKPGATAGAELAGGTTSGAPTTGDHVAGELVVAQDGQLWICTAAGAPGTWTAVSGSGGSVTSVALAGPTGTTVSGSPVTGSGTLTLAWSSESAHTVLIGPTSGSAAAPTFRTLVAADLPASAVINPMTAQGSLIQGAASGTPAELALDTIPARTPGAVGSDVAWITPADRGGWVHPCTTANDLLYYNPQTVTSLVLGGIGDSIMAGAALSAGQDPLSQCATQLASLLGITVTTSNQAIGGTTTTDWLSGGAHLPGAVTSLVGAGVRLVVLMLGTNDAYPTVAITTATHLANMQSICNYLVAHGLTVLVCYPPYVVPGAQGGIWGTADVTRLHSYQAYDNLLPNGFTVRQGDATAFLYFTAHQSELQSDQVHPTATGATSLGTAWAYAALGAVGALTQETALQRLALGTNLSISSGTLNAAGGGYSDPLTTRGDLVARTAGATTRQAVGADGTALVADSSQSTGIAWGTIAAQTSSLLVLLPNPYNFVDDSATDNGQPPDFIMTAAGDVIGVGGA